MTKKYLIVLWALLLVACFQVEPPLTSTSVEQSTSQSGKQSGTEVKSQEKKIDLLPLGTQTIDADKPDLRGVAERYAAKISHVQVEDGGVVVKVLSDDTNGSRHQKFLVKIASGKTLLFAHNIDLAPRIGDIKVGDQVEFRGEYVYNPKGGVIHWTHQDPQGEHYAGWIKHNGKTYN